MPHPRAEVFWQVTHHRNWQDDKCQGGGGGWHAWNWLSRQYWNNVLISYNSPFLALRVFEVRGGIPGQGEEGEGAGAGVALDSLFL